MAMRVALMGAGGKMGCRITDNLRRNPDYAMSYVEISAPGIANLRQRGLAPTPQDEALAQADAVILAVPDRLIGRITHEIVPKLRRGTLVVGLDPAAAYAGVMPAREDITYFVSHPCHPPVFHDETTPEARTDWFGGVYAKQDIVCALHYGPEADYAKGERIARDMYAPVMRAFRVTVEQMAILEPALVETLSSTCITIIREAFDEAVRMGVPRDAALAFLMGHIRIQLAVLFDYAGFPFSEGAQLAIARARDLIFRPDWQANVMNLDALRRSVAEITDSLSR